MNPSPSPVRLAWMLWAAGLSAVLPVGAQAPNAWQITDNSATGGSTLNYTVSLPSGLRAAATNQGFTYAVTARYVTNFGGANSQTMIYAVDARRFLVWFNLTAGNDLTAQPEGGPVFTLTTNGTGTVRYHRHEFVFDPATQTASYVVDGAALTNGWRPLASATPAGTVYFGAGSSAGMGQMNYHRARFAITNEPVASYDAGTAGSPPVAPDPVSQGWTLNQTHPALTSAAPVSPDATVLPVAATLAADSFSPGGVRLNGQVDARGSPTLAQFEWGPTTNYGRVTPATFAGSAVAPIAFSATVDGLEVGQEFHFRLVAQSGHGFGRGTNLSFRQPGFVLTPLPGVPQIEKAAWGDYDGDRRLDFLLNGYEAATPVSQLWRNVGGGFTNASRIAPPGAPGIGGGGAVTWADHDGDGLLDLLLMGREAGFQPVSRLWRNVGGSFVDVTATAAVGLPGLEQSSAAWGDFDRDGRADFVLMGLDSRNVSVAQLWRNTGGGFINVTASAAPGLPQVAFGSVAWGDYDADGWPDLLLTGADTTPGSFNIHSQIWRNTGGGLTNVTGQVAPNLREVMEGSAAWGDYDADGRLDFLVMGRDAQAAVSQLWRNTGAGFTEVTGTVAPGLPGTTFGTVAWADFDNDGRLDFLLTGRTNQFGPGRITQLWRNEGGRFTNVTAVVAPELPGVSNGSATWGDYDGDGRLDLLLTGYDDAQSVSQLWRNLTPAANIPPGAPAGLALTVSGEGALLSWRAAADAQTATAGLSYQVRAGTKPGGSDLLAAAADPASGARHLPAPGGAGPALRLPLAGVTNGQTIYWSVQAVDAAFAGGPFADETSEVSFPRLSLTLRSPAGAVVSWTPPTWGWFLQASPDMAPDHWSNASSGEENPASVSILTPEPMFLRLVAP